MNQIFERIHSIVRIVKNFYRDTKYGGKFLGHKAIITRYGYLGAHKSANSGYADLENYFSKIEVNSDDILVDIGCGKGRVINFWLEKYPHNQMLGIELDPEIAEFTSNRLSEYSNVSILCGNAIELFPEQGTIFYLYNPFNEAVTKQFFDVLLSKTNNHHEIIVIYHNHDYLYLIEENRKFQIKKYSLALQTGAIITINNSIT